MLSDLFRSACERVAVLVTVLVLIAGASAASAATLRIRVLDAASERPIPSASVSLRLTAQPGGFALTASTDDQGDASVTDVPPGSYYMYVSAAEYVALTRYAVDVRDDSDENRLVVSLAHRNAVKIIGSVKAQRRDASGFLRSPLSELPLDLQPIVGAPLTVSIDEAGARGISVLGADPTEVGVFINGSRANAPGSAFDMRAINPDLLSLTSVDPTGRGANSGGSAGFSTIYPTLAWRGTVVGSGGSFDTKSVNAILQGTAGFVGLAVQHSTRSAEGRLNGLGFADASGLDYVHRQGVSTSGDVLAVQGDVGANAVRATILSSARHADLACATVFNVVPCGFGPGSNGSNSYFGVFLQDRVAVGALPLTIAGSMASTTARINEEGRLLDLVPAPFDSLSSSRNRSFQLDTQFATGARSAASVSAGVTGSSFSSNSRFGSSLFASSTSSSEMFFSASNSFQITSRFSVTPVLDLSAGGSISAATTGASAVWRGAGGRFDIGVARATARTSSNTAFTPLNAADLVFECSTGTASIAGNVQQTPGTQGTTTYHAGYQGEWGASTGLSVQMYHKEISNAIVSVPVSAAVLDPSLFGPGFFAAASQIYASGSGCGATSSLSASNIFVTFPATAARGIYDGGVAIGYHRFNRNVAVGAAYAVTVAKDVFSQAASPLRSTLIAGAQFPNVPLQRGYAALIYTNPPHSLSGLIKSNLVSANNGYNLPRYVVTDAAIGFRNGPVSAFVQEQNVFNAHSPLFGSSSNAVSLATTTGAPISTIAYPLPPRRLVVSANVDLTKIILAARGQKEADDFDPVVSRLLSYGFPGIAPLNRRPAGNPLTIAPDRLNGSCTAETQARLMPTLAAFRSFLGRVESHEAPPPGSIPRAQIEARDVPGGPLIFLTPLDPELQNDVINCLVMHVGTQQQAKRLGLQTYRPDNTVPNGSYIIGFRKDRGFYWVKPRVVPSKDTLSYRYYPLGAALPKDAFIVEDRCPADRRAAAEHLLAELQQARSRNWQPSSTVSWLIAPAGTTPPSYKLEIKTETALPTVFGCAHITGLSKREADDRHVSNAALPALNFSDTLGLYVVR